MRTMCSSGFAAVRWRREVLCAAVLAVVLAGAAQVLGPVSAAARAARAGDASHQAGPAAAKAGTLLAWGSNRLGDLGDGTTVNRDVPVAVRLPRGTKIIGVSAGGDHTLARTSTGQVLAWGDNRAGQLGDGTRKSSSTPVQLHLPRGVKVISVKAGCRDSLALTSTGQVLAWGENVFGELGDGTRVGSATPVSVHLPAGTKVSAISAGCYFDLALTGAGHVLAWGRNYTGSLGDGNLNTTSPVPVRVRLRPHLRVTAISAGGAFGMALTASRQLYAWGYNGIGQLGDGTTRNRDVPVLVALPRRAIGKVVAVADGDDHSLALLANGSMLAWGLNDLGQLGTGGDSALVPTRVLLPPGVTATAITAGAFHSMALTSSGGILAWGWNNHGQLGDGSMNGASVPIAVNLPAHVIVMGIGAGCASGDSFAIVRTG